MYIEIVILCLRLETLLPSLYQLLLSNFTTATKLLPNQTLSSVFKLLLIKINMWHFAYDDLRPPLCSPALPLFPQYCCPQVLRVLDPP